MNTGCTVGPSAVAVASPRYAKPENASDGRLENAVDCSRQLHQRNLALRVRADDLDRLARRDRRAPWGSCRRAHGRAPGPAGPAGRASASCARDALAPAAGAPPRAAGRTAVTTDDHDPRSDPGRRGGHGLRQILERGPAHQVGERTGRRRWRDVELAAGNRNRASTSSTASETTTIKHEQPRLASPSFLKSVRHGFPRVPGHRLPQRSENPAF